MSYEPTIWKKGDKVTSTKLNKIENGIQGNDEEITSIKEGLNAIQTATSSDVGKALKAKTVANGKVAEWEFGEAGGADPEVIEQAVTDWLDNHPEATTTVQDGSITEAKLATTLAPALKNDYVTPEMFGAVGDGTTDDTQAIKDMFASSAKKFVFLHDTYKVTGGIQVTTAGAIVDFGGKTSFTLDKSYDIRDFDYVIGFCAINIITRGFLCVYANKSVNVGIWLSKCAGSRFEHLSCSYARVWGIATDISHASLGSLKIDYMEATACGYKVNATAIATSKDHLMITGMQVGDNLTADAIRSIFDYTKFDSTCFVIDDSNYQDTTEMMQRTAGSRLGWWTSTGIVLDQSDVTKGTYVCSRGTVSTAYHDDNDATVGRNVFIPVGGGILLEPSASEGLCDIGKISTMRNGIGTVINFQYGGTVRNLASQYDTIMLSSRALALTIDYMYEEACGTGYTIVDKYKETYFISSNASPRIYVTNPFVGQSGFPFLQENEIICNNQTDIGTTNSYTCLQCPSYLSAKKLEGVNVYYPSTAFATTVTEYSPRDYTLDIQGFGAAQSIVLDLLDPNSKRRNRFEPFRMYVNKYEKVGTRDNVKIALSDNLIALGYTLNGSVDNLLLVDSSLYNRQFVITIILFNKTFFVTAEQLSFVDNTVTP